MNVFKATNKYEEWLAQQATVVPADFAIKHRRMREAAFPFFRAKRSPREHPGNSHRPQSP